MQRILLVAAAAFLPYAAGAQEQDTTRRAGQATDHTLPRATAREIVALYNAPAALRVSGRVDISEGQQVSGDVAVLEGPVTIAGHVTGRVLAVNADVVLRATARIDGDLIVVGGLVQGGDADRVGGEIRVHRQVLHYREDGDRIVLDDAGELSSGDRFWRRWERRNRRGVSKLALGSSGTYNRVEGLSVYIGPMVHRQTSWGSVGVKAYGIIRTADEFHWDSENLGHSLTGEIRLGRGRGLALTGRLFDVVDPVEDWQLSNLEVGLASFLLHRDFRDYFGRHGGRVSLSGFLGEDADITVGLSDERWRARRERDPFTLFRNAAAWRANPVMDEGAFHVANATLRIDTRNDVDDPWAGWYLVADYERGTGSITRPATELVANPSGAGRTTYSRGFLDMRRYNRLSPESSLNVRLVLGGWLGGDRLPLQRRFSLGGPGTLPGFDFRRVTEPADVGVCNEGAAPPGQPAQCERVLLAQAEYRGELHFDLFDDDDGFDENDRRWRGNVQTNAEWVIFADAGRGWLVGPRDGTLQYPAHEIPGLATLRTDLGVGLELHDIGFYVAKAVSVSHEPANFFVRVRRRF